jgi:hypothetical protein
MASVTSLTSQSRALRPFDRHRCLPPPTSRAKTLGTVFLTRGARGRTSALLIRTRDYDPDRCSWRFGSAPNRQSYGVTTQPTSRAKGLTLLRDSTLSPALKFLTQADEEHSNLAVTLGSNPGSGTRCLHTRLQGTAQGNLSLTTRAANLCSPSPFTHTQSCGRSAILRVAQ